MFCGAVGEVRQHALVDQRRRGLGRHAVGDLRRQVLLVLRVVDEDEVLLGIGLVRRALHDHPRVDRVEIVRPDDLEVLLVLVVGGGDAAVVGVGHHHFARGEELRRLRALFPPDDVGLELVELLERALDAGRRWRASCRRPAARRRRPSARSRASSSGPCAARACPATSACSRSRPSSSARRP